MIWKSRQHLASLFAIAVWALAPTLVAEAAALRPQGLHPADGWPLILGNGIHSSPAVADVDGDGRDELAVGTRDGRVFLIDGHGRILPGWPRDTAHKIYLSPIFHDVDGDGRLEVLIASCDQRLHAWRISGEAVPGWPVELDAMPVSAPRLCRSGSGRPPAILIGGCDGRIWLLNGDGSVRSGWPQQTSATTRSFQHETSALLAADLDGDDRDEVLWLAQDEAVLYVWRSDGRDVPGFPLRVGGAGVGLAVSPGAAAPLIACTTASVLRLLDREGRTVWSATPSEPGDEFESTAVFLPAAFAAADSVAPGADRLLAAGTRQGRVEVWDARGHRWPGWPRILRGFIYGRVGSQNRYDIYAPLRACDVDADGVPELIVGSYDQHLYAFESDGALVPGWPLTLGDAITAAPVFAQLDGRGSRELVVGQYAETLAAFRLEPLATEAADGGGLADRLRLSAGVARSLVPVLLLVLGLLVARLLRRHRAILLGAWGERRRWRGLPGVLAAVLLLRGLWGVVEIVDYEGVRRSLTRCRPTVSTVLQEQQSDLERQVTAMAALLDSLRRTDLHAQADWLAPLEHVADVCRLDYRHAGLLLVGDTGRVLAATGLAREWGGLERLADRRCTGLEGYGPVALGDTPVLLSTAALAATPGAPRLLYCHSLLDVFPQDLADAVGASVAVLRDGRTLAWAGLLTGHLSAPTPWLSKVEPADQLPLGASAFTIRLSRPDYARRWATWVDLLLVLLLPPLAVFGLTRAVAAPSQPIDRLWLPAFALIYVVGWLLLSEASFRQRPVPLALGWLEVLLHGVGLLGLLLALRLFIGAGLARRLSLSLLGSYLLVGLAPLILVTALSASLLNRAQNEALRAYLEDIETRADHLLLAYLGNQRFAGDVQRVSERLFEPSLNQDWFNFVADDQLFFTYDLPSAYLTLRAQDRADPSRVFTGFSFRAPRTEKFFAALPAWATGEAPRGLFLEHGTPLIRAVRDLRTPKLSVQLSAHVPLDRTVLSRLDEKLRVLPYLPQVQVTPTWVGAGPLDPEPEGWILPMSSRLAVLGRDWRTGTPRWMVLDVQAYLPAGREMMQVLATLVLLALAPLALSMWGAWFTFRRTVRPLNELMAGIQKVQQGDLEFRIGHTGRSEIAQAGRAFDAMAGSLQQTVLELAEKKKVEEVSELKSRFISMVSHDLKTPLASIQGATENILAEMAGPLTENQRLYLDMILESSRNLQQKIGDILDLSRADSGHLELQLEVLDVRLEVDNVLRSLAPLLQERGLRAELEVTTSRTEVRADRTRLWQIVNNLVSNAVAHAPQGGRIGVLIADEAASGALAVTVTDDGPGIAAEDRDRIFEPFFTGGGGGRTEHGAGLGLAIVKQLVTLHGGRIEAGESASGGAAMTFTLLRRRD